MDEEAAGVAAGEVPGEAPGNDSGGPATEASKLKEAAGVLAAIADRARPESSGPEPSNAAAAEPAREGHIFVLPEEIEQATFLAALHEGIRALHERDRARERRDRLPANVGKPWTPTHDTDLLAAFDAGMPLEEIAKRLQRTRIGVRTRLERHGRLSPA